MLLYMYSLPRSRLLDVTQRGGALRDIQNTAARETSTCWIYQFMKKTSNKFHQRALTIFFGDFFRHNIKTRKRLKFQSMNVHLFNRQQETV